MLIHSVKCQQELKLIKSYQADKHNRAVYLLVRHQSSFTSFTNRQHLRASQESKHYQRESRR